MTDFRIFMKLFLAMMIVSLGAIAITTSLLYMEALKVREHLLSEIAARYLRSISAAMEFQELHAVEHHSSEIEQDHEYILKRFASIIRRASRLGGLRGDFELVFAVLRDDKVLFLHKYEALEENKREIPMGSNLAVPMQLALQGKRGTIRERDYNGERVLAAYTYYKKDGVGIVAKSRTTDINMRFIKGASLATLPAIFLVLIGSWFFWRTSSPIVKRLRSDNLKFRRMANERDTANKSLAESEQRLQCFFDAAFEGIVITKDGVFIDSNKRFAAMYGYTVKEMIGMPIADLVHPEDLDLVRKNIENEFSETYEHRSIHKDGRTMLVEVHGRAAQLQGRKVRITAIHDLSDREKKHAAQQELAERKMQSSKLEAIGNFAAGITHDFNNLLTPIIGHCDLLKLKIKKHAHEDSDECQSNVSKIQNAAETAQLLVKRIQTFTRKESSPIEPIPLKVDACIIEAFDFLRSMTPASIDMDMDLEPNLGLISLSDVTIRQILMNLVKNSTHAIGDEPGKIFIDVSNENVMVERLGLTIGPHIKIEVEDNGCGMSEEVLEKALDPYFTTKNEEGTGLGLAVVQGILDNHGGLIRLQSEEDLGTKAIVYIPALAGAHDGQEACGFDESVILGENQRIFFVDDDEDITLMVKDILTSLQYDVVVFTDANEAFKEFCLNPSVYDVFMSDLTMPNMTGLELIRKVKKVNPEIKVILSSGLGSSGRFRADLYGDIIDVYMTKPITRREYAKVLSDLFKLEASD